MCLTLLIVVHSCKASSPISRPKPLCLTPPKGVFGLSTAQQLTVTVPTSMAFETRYAREVFSVKMAALRPSSESFALAMTSASVLNVAMVCEYRQSRVTVIASRMT